MSLFSTIPILTLMNELTYDYGLKYNSRDLYNYWKDMIITNNLVIHNHEFTRYAPHQKPSIIDHITSNCPQHLTNIITKPCILADHCSLTFDYNHKPKNLKPRFRMVRDNSKLTKDNLIHEVENNPNLQNLYNLTDPNQVANVLQNELNHIINRLAPKSRVQIRNDK